VIDRNHLSSNPTTSVEYVQAPRVAVRAVPLNMAVLDYVIVGICSDALLQYACVAAGSCRQRRRDASGVPRFYVASQAEVRCYSDAIATNYGARPQTDREGEAPANRAWAAFRLRGHRRRLSRSVKIVDRGLVRVVLTEVLPGNHISRRVALSQAPLVGSGAE